MLHPDQAKILWDLVYIYNVYRCTLKSPVKEFPFLIRSRLGRRRDGETGNLVDSFGRRLLCMTIDSYKTEFVNPERKRDGKRPWGSRACLSIGLSVNSFTCLLFVVATPVEVGHLVYFRNKTHKHQIWGECLSKGFALIETFSGTPLITCPRRNLKPETSDEN